MVKKIEEKVKELVEGKKQNIDIHFFGQYDFVQEREVPKVVDHADIAGYSLNADWVAVMTKEGTTHIYPASEVTYIKHYTAE